MQRSAFSEQMIYVPPPPAGAVSWQSAVTALGDLPTPGNYVGEVRYVISSANFYFYDGVSWILLTGGGGGGGDIDGGIFI